MENGCSSWDGAAISGLQVLVAPYIDEVTMIRGVRKGLNELMVSLSRFIHGTAGALPLDDSQATMQFSKSLQQYLAGRYSEGADEEEVSNLEDRYDLKLPQDYREFLLRAGWGVEGLWVGSHYGFGFLPDMQEAAVEQMEAAGLKFPKGAFTFLMHQGYQFFYITGDGIYYYHEGNPAPVKEHNSFAEFFEVAKNGW